MSQGVPDKFQQHGLRDVLLPRLALQPAAQLAVGPARIRKVEVVFLGLADVLLGDLAHRTEVDFPLDAGFREAKLSLRKRGGIIQQAPPVHLQKGVFLGDFQRAVELEAQLWHSERDATLRRRRVNL